MDKTNPSAGTKLEKFLLENVVKKIDPNAVIDEPVQPEEAEALSKEAKPKPQA